MIMFDRRLLENFDWIFLGLTLSLVVLGVINLYSASQVFAGSGTPVYLKQIYWAVMGLLLILAILLLDYHYLQNMVWILYVAGLVFLVLVLLIGYKTGGAQRWIDLKLFRFQPSEFVKVIVLIALAHHFSRKSYPNGLGFKDLGGPALIVGVPFLLILRQPDLGTAMHMTFACGSVIMFIKLRKWVMIVLGIGVAVLTPFGWMFLKDYQRTRILTFLNPEKDPLGAGYHIIQSKIAVGSGQFWGKGFLQGTQSQLRFLPEQHTDFAFSVFAEEWGFVGSVVLLALFFLFILAGLRIVHRSKDRFGTFLGLGLISLVFWQFFINIGMVIGLMPVVGLPMPFISYGGTSMLTVFACVGLLLSIGMRRYLFQEKGGGSATENQ